MKYNKLGQTDLDVSVICLGTMTFGEQNTEQDAHSQLDYATSQGINFIDTAELYPIPMNAETQGRTESYIGSWLAQRKDRDKLVIATKVVGPGGPQVAHFRNGPDLSRSQINEALHASLKRLQTDYVDLYQVHWPARITNYFGQRGYVPSDSGEETPIRETLTALSDLVKSGKVRHIGISNESPWGTLQYLKLAEQENLERIVSIQNPYNLLNRSFEVGMAEISYREQVGLLAYSPLAFGMLTGKYLDGEWPCSGRITIWRDYFTRYASKNGYAATKRYVDLAREYGMSPAQTALAFINNCPFLTSNIIGATTLGQLKENIDSWKIELDEEIVTKIEEIHESYPNPCP